MEVEEPNRRGLAVDELTRARSLFPFTNAGKVYLNHAATGPLSTRVVDAMTSYLKERSVGRLENYPVDVKMVAECRTLVQQLIGAESPERIAFFGNTTDALNVIASGVPWRTGDRVLSNTLEFPANVYPYLNLKQRGVELDSIATPDGRVTPEMIHDALRPRTKLIALSAVQFLTGYRADLAAVGELCRNRGIIFAVDGVQAVGAVQIDVKSMKIDALACGGQKWLMSPHGSGFLYLTEELQSFIRQQQLGWLSVEDPWDFHNYSQPLAPSARRYECGSLPMPSLWGMHAAVSTLLEFGTEAIEHQILALTQILIDQFAKTDMYALLSPTERHERGGIVTVKLRSCSVPATAMQALSDSGITIALREGKFRLSPHFYNSPEEMTTVVSAMQRVITSSLQ
jgi:selenocysteine lyase/cysteine desulfurase